MPEPHPNELTFEESVAVSAPDPRVRRADAAVDPHRRRSAGRADLYAADRRSAAARASVFRSLPPPRRALTRDVLVRLKEHGVEGLGLSLDGSTAEKHDSIRGVPGTFDRTMQAMRWAQELDMPLQVNTLVAAETAGDDSRRFTNC